MALPETFDGSIESAVDLMISPEVLGTSEPEPEAPKVEEEEAPQVEEPEAELPEVDDEVDPEFEETPEIEDVQLEAETPEVDGTKPDMFTVKVDGEDKQVSMDDLKQGYSGQQYVQQGMKEAAESRKEAQQVFQQLQQERQMVTNVLTQIQQGGFQPPPQAPDTAMFESDPIRYMEAKIQYDEAKTVYDTQIGNLREIAGRATEADKQAMNVHIKGELKQLRALEPDFSTPERAKKSQQGIVAVASKVYGYTSEEISQIVDHRALRVLLDAKRYHDLKASTAKAEVKVPGKTVRTTARRKPVKAGEAQRRQQRAKLKSTGDIDDALGLLFNT